MIELVSVIVPVYNKACYIERTLDSILAQTHSKLEIILIDDGSTDGSDKIIADYAKKDSRIKAIFGQNHGSAFARNKGLELACGEYISFVDADDIISPDFIEKLLFQLKNTQSDIAVVKDFRVANGWNKKVKAKACKKAKVYDTEQAVCTLFSGKKFGVGPCNKLFKREVLFGERKVTFPENIFYSEDVPFVLDAFLNSQKTVYLPIKSYAYRRAKNSAVTSRLTQKKLTTLDGMDYCKSKILSTNLDSATTYVLGWRVLVHFEIFYYMQRDKFFDESTKTRILKVFKSDLVHLKKGKQFPLYRRLLLPLAIPLCHLVYNVKNKNKKD